MSYFVAIPVGGTPVSIDANTAPGFLTNEDLKFGILQAQGGDIRYRSDGTAPTASTGMIVVDGAAIDCQDPARAFRNFILSLKLIAVGQDCTLACEFYDKRG